MLACQRIIVISDLHLGGEEPAPSRLASAARGSRINSSYRELAEFVRWIAQSEEPTELVLNGDIVDFLLDYLDSPATTFIRDPAAAATRLRRIASDCPVFDAWGELVRTRKHQLTLLLGNHDIELSFSLVRECFAELLKVPLAWLQFVVDGEALVRGRVLIEHGNRYDPWNWVDHDGLRHERSLQSRALSIERLEKKDQFQAPNGTRLVIELMNELKSRYRFVDLLKPEDTCAIPLLLGLLGHAERATAFLKAIPRITQNQWDCFSKQTPDKHPDDPLYIGGDSISLEDELRASMGANFEALGWGNVEELTISALGDFKGWLSKKLNALAPKLVFEGLIAWIASRGKEKFFALDYEDESYLAALRSIAATERFQVVVLGHTHLPKSIQLTTDVRYFNSGTWVDVMKIENVSTLTNVQVQAISENLLANELSAYLHCFRSFVELRLHADGSVQEANVFGFESQANPRQALA
jgi:UDP-2,3-diacylglucosamine pyrophosphatase LpxH